jgi:hypothetical protein
MTCVRDLLVHAIDYAGLFPPAGLDMETSVRNYATYRKGPDRWALGRFVLPVGGLEDFEAKAAPLLEEGEPWPLSVLGGNDLAADMKAIETFRERHLRNARIASLEIKTATVDGIRKAAAVIGRRIETFFEIPIAQDPAELLDAIHATRGRAKVRTGGTTRGAAPPPADLARFLRLASSRAAFKATAGLHHAVRNVRPLTYEAGCDTDVLHGFLNVFLASCRALQGSGDDALRKTLEDQELAPFREGGAAWSGVGPADARRSRSEFFLSFGSCSFDEPVAELKELKLL